MRRTLMLRLLSAPITHSVYTCTQRLRHYLYCCTNNASKLRRTLMLRLLSAPLTHSVYTCTHCLRHYLYCCTNNASKLRRTFMLRLLSEPLTPHLRRRARRDGYSMHLHTASASVFVPLAQSVYTWTPLLSQYLYFCTSVCVSICTFVLIKQVN